MRGGLAGGITEPIEIDLPAGRVQSTCQGRRAAAACQGLSWSRAFIGLQNGRQPLCQRQRASAGQPGARLLGRRCRGIAVGPLKGFFDRNIVLLAAYCKAGAGNHRVVLHGGRRSGGRLCVGGRQC